MLRIILGTFLILGLVSSLEAQSLKVPSASPSQTIKQDFGLGSVEINYSRPAAKGRKVFGDLVPFGKMWRTGANAATTIKFSNDVKINNREVKAGEYALYTIPGEQTWEFILNSVTTNWGISGYDRAKDVMRFFAPVQSSALKFENFTILMDGITQNEVMVSLAWENTIVTFPVSMDIDEAVMAQIDNIFNKDNKPYYQAANYYYENNKDLKQALTWINKAIEQNPKAYWVMHLKAKIQAKSGDKAGAKASAEASTQLAREAKNDDYIALNRNLINSL
jgi:tetratricopeptide (TPR) repeat protein